MVERDWTAEVKQLATVAPYLARKDRATEMEPCYDVMSDALHWLDEWPLDEWTRDHHRFGELLVIRYLLSHRTRVILGEPPADYQVLWDTGLRLFPTWVGFSEERRKPELAAVFRAKRAASGFGCLEER